MELFHRSHYDGPVSTYNWVLSTLDCKEVQEEPHLFYCCDNYFHSESSRNPLLYCLLSIAIKYAYLHDLP